MESVFSCVILFVVGILVGFINTIAGGGSSFLYPVLMLMGFSPHDAVGTSRPAFLLQGISGILGFKSKGIFHFPQNLYVGLFAFLGSIIGALISLKVSSPAYKKIILIIILIVTLIGFFKKNITRFSSEKLIFNPLKAFPVFFLIGMYSGFIQTGLGFLILFTMQSVFHTGLTTANSIKAMIVFMAGIPALYIFALDGHVHWMESFFIAAGTAIGAWFTSRWSVEVNQQKVRKIIMFIILILIFKLLNETF